MEPAGGDEPELAHSGDVVELVHGGGVAGTGLLLVDVARACPSRDILLPSNWSRCWRRSLRTSPFSARASRVRCRRVGVGGVALEQFLGLGLGGGRRSSPGLGAGGELRLGAGLGGGRDRGVGTGGGLE